MKEVWLGIFPSTWPDSVFLPINSLVLEEEPLIACFTCVEISFEVDLSDFDSLARLSIEVRLTFRCSPGIDIHDFDPAFAMSIIIDIIALCVEVVSESVIPLLFPIVREIVYAFVL